MLRFVDDCPIFCLSQRIFFREVSAAKVRESPLFFRIFLYRTYFTLHLHPQRTRNYNFENEYG